jgi:hypothetical protein
MPRLLPVPYRKRYKNFAAYLHGTGRKQDAEKKAKS